MTEKDTRMREDLLKAGRNKKIYLAAGLGLFGLGVALFVFFFVRRDLPALLLGCIAFVWGALLVNQALRTRDIEDMIEARIAETEGETETQEREPGEPANGAGPESGDALGEEGEPGEP